ncbi:MAG: sulfurtransferase TusA family protein [Nitriliruptoraceae bacterium]
MPTTGTESPMVEVDARGLACPLPVIELARAIDGTSPGGRVRLLATDVAAKVDVPVWCRMQRHQLVSLDEVDAHWVFVVERRTG